MSELTNTADIARVINDLRGISEFADLAEEQLAWLAQHMEEQRFDVGAVVAHKGDPLEHLIVILEGEMQIDRPASAGAPVFYVQAGQVTGLLPFSRSTHYMGTGRVVKPLHALRMHKQHFPEMLQRIPLLGQRLVAVMSDRIREVVRIETQQEKLMALGKLSAGLAHELNNPAAAARRSAQSLMEALENVRDASMRLLRHAATEEQRNAIFQFELAVGKKACETGEDEDPLALSDREEQITLWLEANGVNESWKIARILAEAELEESELQGLKDKVGGELISDALHRVASIVTILCLIQEINNSTKRISELVTAIKRYSYMDQAPIQEVNLHEDLENTLKIFGHRLKAGVAVARQFDAELPIICARGSELNQVWTNLIDNAIDAMDGHGELRVRTQRELDFVVVEIGDNGPGIPAEVQSRIFEPFYTTKKVGQGTGMGLDAVMRIVRAHHGQIEVKSKPGDTTFRVRIPVNQPRATPA